MAKRGNEENERLALDGGRLETEESFARIENYIRSEIETVQADPQIGREYLYRTGMYERNGQLKPEFA